MDYDRLYPDEKDRTFEIGGHSLSSRTPSNRNDQNKRLKSKIKKLEQQIESMKCCGNCCVAGCVPQSPTHKYKSLEEIREVEK